MPFANINNTIVLIIIFLFKTSLFDIKEIAFNFIYEFLNKNEYKEFLGHLDKYVTYFYYPRNKTNENLKVYQNLINIGKINHNYLEENENKKKFMENYNKNHYNIIMEKLFNKSRDIFLNRKILLYFNILLEIASKNNSDFILKFLNLVKEEMSKKVPNIFKNCKKLIQYLLDTSYQAYLIKYSKEKNIEFNPGFDIDETKDQKETDKIVDDILFLSSSSLQKIFILDIYKLDFFSNKGRN